MSTIKIFMFGSFACIGLYLFASRPPELPDSQSQNLDETKIEIVHLFNTVNALNEAARFIYTKKIVGGGKKAGLKFGEDWSEPGVEKGPLPALFLRLVAGQLERRPEPLGLYLGSDEPINKSNLFSKDQLLQFQEVKASLTPRFSSLEDERSVAMYPDFASVDACVTCHNEHNDSPKTDWKLNDVMGATTWTYPSKAVSQSQMVVTSKALYASVVDAYQTYLNKTKSFSEPVSIEKGWPDETIRVLPDVETFMTAVLQEAGAAVTHEILATPSTKQE